MTLIQELGVLEELVINRASVAEIRGQIIPFREKLKKKLRALEKCNRFKATHMLLVQSYEQLEAQFTELKNTTANEKAALQKENLRLKVQHDKVVKSLEAQIFGYTHGSVFRGR